LIVDDAHWLDRSSLGVLTFIARRLETEPIALLGAVRDGYLTTLEGERLSILRLERLDALCAAELLDRNAPDLHPIVRARVLAEAAGNPLALVELAQTLPPSASARQRLAPAPTTLTARLELAFAARLNNLQAEARLALLAAALDPRASLGEIVRCATVLHGRTVAVCALDAVVEQGIVEIVETELRFRHPLMRSAVRQVARPAQLVAMYGALAETVVDPERQLWHRAMAAVGGDEEIAVALEEHARSARRRGAVAVAAAALERSAALSLDPRRKGERLVRAAEVAYELGRGDVVRRVIGQAEQLDLGLLEAARLAWLRQMISGDVWFETGAAKTFVAIARQMVERGDADMALRSLVPIAHRCWWTRPRASTRRYLVKAAEEIGVPESDPRLLAVIALAHPEMTGPGVLRHVSATKLHEAVDPLAAMCLGIAAEKSGDFALGLPYLARAVERLREQGTLGMLTQALVHYAWAATHTGDWAAAADAGVEAAGLAFDTGQPQFGLTGQLIAALTSALRGTEPDLEQMIAGPEKALLAMKAGPMLAPAHLARGAAALGDSRHEDAFRHLWPIFDESSPAFHRFMRWSAVLDLVESGGRGEHAQQVLDVLAELEEIARESSPPILCASLLCARPLMASDEDAETLYTAALEADLARYAFLRARTLFSFGRWLRRQRRSIDSRGPLREAVKAFEALGASSWRRSAQQELRATGERIARQTPGARDRLTAQELRIAELAAEGLSNREIGERLVLSHRTVGSHLYRIFPKLEITARAQLRDALAATASDD
jgi:DNA-binding CsgD family transcriptional regulator